MFPKLARARDNAVQFPDVLLPKVPPKDAAPAADQQPGRYMVTR